LVLVQHLNRRSDTDEALSRIADSQGIPALARSVLIWGSSPEDPDGERGDMKVLTRAESNLARASTALLFRISTVTIDGGIEAPALELIGESDARAEDLTADPETRSRTDEAIRWLTDYLAAGSQPSEAVKSAAAEAEITTKCLRVARERICVSFRPGGMSGPYHWKLRASDSGDGHSRAFTGIHVVAQDAQDAQADRNGWDEDQLDALVSRHSGIGGAA
jgi:hypothetical protein